VELSCWPQLRQQRRQQEQEQEQEQKFQQRFVGLIAVKRSLNQLTCRSPVCKICYPPAVVFLYCMGKDSGFMHVSPVMEGSLVVKWPMNKRVDELYTYSTRSAWSGLVVGSHLVG
jgi:hypothetical protein